MNKETNEGIIIFDQPDQYDQYLKNHDLSHYSNGRATGLRFKDGHTITIIDQSYYAQAGITDPELKALDIHEQTELDDDGPDAHTNATRAEYGYILKTFGREQLVQYHSRICSLIGGINDIRVEVFNEILGTQKST